MFNFAPFIVPMAIGALSSMASGRNPVEGAAIGAATQGLLGGVDFGGASSLLSGAGSSGVANTVTPSMGGLGFSGATSAIPGSFSAAVPGVTASGLTTSVPQTAGQYSSIYGGDAALQNYDMGMNSVTSQLNTGANTVPFNVGSSISETDLSQLRNSYMNEVNPQVDLSQFRDSYMNEAANQAVEQPISDKYFDGILPDASLSDTLALTQLGNQAYMAQTEPEQIETYNLPPITKKEIEPSKGKLMAINSPRYARKNIRFV
jgi:hypothetical protein